MTCMLIALKTLVSFNFDKIFHRHNQNGPWHILVLVTKAPILANNIIISLNTCILYVTNNFTISQKFVFILSSRFSTITLKASKALEEKYFLTRNTVYTRELSFENGSIRVGIYFPFSFFLPQLPHFPKRFPIQRGNVIVSGNKYLRLVYNTEWNNQPTNNIDKSFTATN